VKEKDPESIVAPPESYVSIVNPVWKRVGFLELTTVSVEIGFLIGVMLNFIVPDVKSAARILDRVIERPFRCANLFITKVAFMFSTFAKARLEIG
jgi:hypothetical protein